MTLKSSSSKVSSGLNLRTDKEAYFIFTSEVGGNGFVVVSGDERMPEILAYSDQNDFDVDNIPPSVQYWFDCYEEAFLELNDSDKPTSKQLEYVNPNGVAPLLGNNTWGQSDPYNRLCPSLRNVRCVTGCVATAMAQVMKYHKYPNTGKGNINYYTYTNSFHLQNDFGSIQFQWDKMLDAYNKSFTQEEANAVAELMFACGTSVQMDYCTGAQGGSGAYQTDLVKAFVDNFFYDDDAAFMSRKYCSIEDWHQILINELNAGRPVNYAGQSARDGGHSFVFDGYKASVDNNYPYYHVNWGWNGDCDGYYQIANLHPSENGQYGTYTGFNNNQQMAIGIKPEDGIDEGMLYLSTPNLYISSSTVKAGDKLKVYSASCINFSYKPFSGFLRVLLISLDDGSETILGESRVKMLNYLQEQSNLNIEITIPTSLADGQYAIQFCSKSSGTDTYQKVFSQQYPTLTVSSAGDITPDVTNEAMLGCSELEALNCSDPSLVCLKIYEVQNLQDSPFIGDIKMILADKSGKQLCSFGDSIQPGELSTFEVIEEPLKIQGQLTGEWPDGDYKLYVGARQINTSRFIYLSFFDITQSDIDYHEISLDAQIKNGKLIINGNTYIIPPTSVEQIDSVLPKDNVEGDYLYCLDGRHVGKFHKDAKSLPSGIYILRQGNKIRKIVVNH